jgi:hypothetical protein
MNLPYNCINFLQIQVEIDSRSATQPYPARIIPAYAESKFIFLFVETVSKSPWPSGQRMMAIYSLLNEAASTDEDMSCRSNLRGLMAYAK